MQVSSRSVPFLCAAHRKSFFNQTNNNNNKHKIKQSQMKGKHKKDEKNERKKMKDTLPPGNNSVTIQK